MRKNLDPFEEYPDHILWNALEEVNTIFSINLICNVVHKFEIKQVMYISF